MCDQDEITYFEQLIMKCAVYRHDMKEVIQTDLKKTTVSPEVYLKNLMSPFVLKTTWQQQKQAYTVPRDPPITLIMTMAIVQPYWQQSPLFIHWVSTLTVSECQR